MFLFLNTYKNKLNNYIYSNYNHGYKRSISYSYKKLD